MMKTINVDIPEPALAGITAIVEAQSDNFLELVAANLDKRTDFVGMSFDKMNLDGLELTGFDFSDADFRDCSLKGTVFVECELKGAAFSFPPEVRDRWSKNLDIFLGARQSAETIELMRIASDAPRKEERKEAAQKLLESIKDEEVASFLQGLSLGDKARSLRSWLRSKLTSSSTEDSTLQAILERSLFEGGQDLDQDISLYVKTMGHSNIAVETLCQACVNNPRAIKKASQELMHDEPFKRFLVNCLSFSSSHSAWREAASAIERIDLSQAERDLAFRMRLERINDKHDLSHLAEAAAINSVRLAKLFELSEHGYRHETKRWWASDFLLYCYSYDQAKYENEVLLHSFNEDRAEEISRSEAFAAYCLVHQPRLYRTVRDLKGYFSVDPLVALGLTESIFHSEHFSQDISDELKRVAQQARDQAARVNPKKAIRPTVDPPSTKES
ncbi:pentapeptide repeat-containing protein [Bradyrhizobium sp. UFLA01-814]|uniref:pentapeptide repeat-containing protein n=1 Tax=Bradyrhizobium sp. UFLA01-814 TaxID=3023480 RepID=UPI00398B39E5